MATIGWQSISIAVTTILIAGCAGLFLFAQDLVQETIGQPVIEPVKTLKRTPSSTPIHRYKPDALQEIINEYSFHQALTQQADFVGLTEIMIVEELMPSECGCEPPLDDRAYLLHARQYSAICVCASEQAVDTGSRFTFTATE